jgi:hypothetical protein
MTYQGIRVSLLVFERFLKSVNGALISGALGVFFAVLVMEFSTIRIGMVDLVDKIKNMESVEGFNIKAAFQSPDVAPTIPIFKGWDDDKKASLIADIRVLKPEWFTRLLNVGAQNNLCEFERPTPRMREDLAMDHQLEELGLIKLEPSRDVQAAVMQEMRVKIAKGDPWKIGKPLACYVASLETRGWNVKTAILEYLSAGFASAPTPGAEARGQHRAMRVARNDQR